MLLHRFLFLILLVIGGHAHAQVNRRTSETLYNFFDQTPMPKADRLRIEAWLHALYPKSQLENLKCNFHSASRTDLIPVGESSMVFAQGLQTPNRTYYSVKTEAKKSVSAPVTTPNINVNTLSAIVDSMQENDKNAHLHGLEISVVHLNPNGLAKIGVSVDVAEAALRKVIHSEKELRFLSEDPIIDDGVVEARTVSTVAEVRPIQKHQERYSYISLTAKCELTKISANPVCGKKPAFEITPAQILTFAPPSQLKTPIVRKFACRSQTDAPTLPGKSLEAAYSADALMSGMIQSGSRLVQHYGEMPFKRMRLPSENEKSIILQGVDQRALVYALEQNKYIEANLNYNMIACEDWNKRANAQVKYEINHGDIQNGYLKISYDATFRQVCGSDVSPSLLPVIEQTEENNLINSENWLIETCAEAYWVE